LRLELGQLPLDLPVTFGDQLLAVAVSSQRLSQGEQGLRSVNAHQGLGHGLGGGPDAPVSQLGQGFRVALAGQDRVQDRQTGGAGKIADHVVQLHIHLVVQRFLHVPDVLAAHLHQAVSVAQQRSQSADRPRGWKEASSKPTECRYCSHWQSNTSLFLPGTFLTCRTLTRQT
jgi:hypothetical protein